MRQFREVLGYLLGALLFVGFMPTIMWLASGMPALWPVGTARTIIAVLLVVGGLRSSAKRLDSCLYAMSRQGQSDGCLWTRSSATHPASDDRWPISP